MHECSLNRRSIGSDDGYAPTQGVLRTLQVLRALNIRNGASVLELSRSTGISRPALYRILETLREAGYVSLDLSGRHYSLTMLVRGLAEGFVDEDWVGQVAAPALRALQKEIIWPADLGTFMDNAMWIRETTRPQSPLTIDRGVVGLRFPMLRSATGRAYLAWCPDVEREEILAGLLRTRESGFELVLDRSRLTDLLEETRAQRYGLRVGEEHPESGAIAVPILTNAGVLGCVNITYIRRAHRAADVAARCLDALWRTSTEIADGAHRIASRNIAANSSS
jgi:IclR family mhp operon transcriptional activator